MRKIELHRNGINAHYSNYTYYALDADSREQITEEYARFDAFIEAIYKMGYTMKDFILCF